MANELEFKRDELNICTQKQWIEKLEKSLEENCGEVVKNLVMEGAPADPDADQERFTDFTLKVIHKMDTILPQDIKKQILSDCACRYPTEKLAHIKEDYINYRNSARAHQLLEEVFKEDLESMDIPQIYKDEIIKNGWGLAGKKVHDIITVTKIPDEVEKYFTATDINEKRVAYCHCPRIKKLISDNEQGVSPTYCNCRAGFYKGIWEDITGKDIKVEVLDTILNGSLTCSFSISLNE
jgi:hypothetical protein